MVYLQKLQDKHKSKGLLTLAISVHDNADHARRQTKAMKIRYPVANGYRSTLDRRYGYA